MNTVEQEILEVFAVHDVGDAVMSVGNRTVGIVGCECDWTVQVWQLEGQCTCPDDAMHCRCGFDDHVDQVSEQYMDEAADMANGHVAREVALALGVDEERLVAAMHAHPPQIVDDGDASSQFREVGCGCGWAQILWRVEKTCVCPQGVRDAGGCNCEFGRRIQSVAHTNENRGTELINQHLASALSAVTSPA